MPRGMKNSTSNLNYTGILRTPKKKQLNFNFEVKCLKLIESLKNPQLTQGVWLLNDDNHEMENQIIQWFIWDYCLLLNPK